MLAKIIHQTVHTTKPPANSSLTDEQLQQITQLKPPASVLWMIEKRIATLPVLLR